MATIVTVVGIGAGLYFLFAVIADEPDPAAEAQEQPVACGGSRPDPVTPMSFTQPEDMGLNPEATITATLVTSCGPITIQLDQSASPATANSFVFLAEAGFYQGTGFHRIIDDFMAQGGDPTGTGSGGPGYRVPDEHPDPGFVYEEGVVAMANAGPGSTGSQFFVVSGPNASHLQPTFNVLGRVIAGMESVERISQVPVVPDARGEVSKPTQSVFIEEVVVVVEEAGG